MNIENFKDGRQWRTLSLFADVALSSPKQEDFLKKLGELDDEGRRNFFMYNLDYPKRKGFEHLPVLKDLFFETNDPSGMEMANRYLGGRRHFEILLNNSPWFRKAFDKWVEEFAVYHKANALRQILRIASDPDHRNNYHASKYVLEEDWIAPLLEVMGRGKPSNGKNPVGRPKKEKVAEHAAASEEVKEAMARLGLNVIEGTNE